MTEKRQSETPLDLTASVVEESGTGMHELKRKVRNHRTVTGVVSLSILGRVVGSVGIERLLPCEIQLVAFETAPT